MRFVRHSGIVPEALISARVRDDEHLVAEDGVGTERAIARILGGLHQEPLVLHQGDQADRNLEMLPGFLADPLKGRLRGAATILASARTRRRPSSCDPMGLAITCAPLTCTKIMGCELAPFRLRRIKRIGAGKEKRW
jgi:hypothetical protein